MKIILLILIILISGCSNTHKLNITNIQSMNYDNINLIKNDFDKVVHKISLLEFNEGNIGDVTSKNLKIVTNEKIFNFKVSKDIIYYENAGKTYISENINDLNSILDNIVKEYNDFSFVEINYDKCNINDNSTLIKIDNTNNCIVLNTSKILYNFRINSIVSINEEVTETALIYQKDEITSNKILIKLDILSTPKSKISFDTEYNYTVSILPTYNDENELKLNMSSIQKK